MDKTTFKATFSKDKSGNSIKIFSTFTSYLKCVAVLNSIHLKTPWILWTARIFILILIISSIIVLTCYELFGAEQFVDYIDPALALNAFIYALGAYIILVWKRTDLIALLSDLQVFFDKGICIHIIKKCSIFKPVGEAVDGIERGHNLTR